jgi:hypothetical protein
MDVVRAAHLAREALALWGVQRLADAAKSAGHESLEGPQRDAGGMTQKSRQARGRPPSASTCLPEGLSRVCVDNRSESNTAVARLQD